MNNNLNPYLIDPHYVQISKKQAAEILGFSVTELDRRRSSDPACPKGFQDKGAANNPVRFRLSDIYAYSEHLMSSAIPARPSTE